MAGRQAGLAGKQGRQPESPADQQGRHSCRAGKPAGPAGLLDWHASGPDRAA
jgi:hypothetical protein